MARRRKRRNSDDLRWGYRRPVLRDWVFWLAILLSALGVIASGSVSNPTTTGAWVALALAGTLITIMLVTFVGVAAGVVRGFTDGWKERPRPPEPAASSAPSSSTPPGDATTDAARKLAEKAASLTSSVRKPTGEDVDRTARALGRAAGAARRAYRKE